MEHASFHLVTTRGAELRDPSFHKNLFLGKWCLTNNELLENDQEYLIAPAYGLEFEAKENNTLLVRELELRVVSLLTPTLNSLHSLDFSERQWWIILSYWLRHFLGTVTHRFMAIDNVLQTANVSSFTAYSVSPLEVTPTDTAQAELMVADPVWSNNVDLAALEVLCEFGRKYDIQIQWEPRPHSPRNRFSQEESHSFDHSRLRRKAKGFIGKLMRFGIRSNDTVFVGTYLSRREVLRAQASLGQFPVIPRFLQLPPGTASISKMNMEARALFVNALSELGDTTYDLFLARIIPYQLPTIFIEGFSLVSAKVATLPMPARPKRVVTANEFAYNEVFKVWLSQKISTGTEYVAMQHGCNYGTHRWRNPTVEELTCDRFVTWGWGNGKGKNVAGFIFKPTHKAKQNRNPSALLLSEEAPAMRNRVWDQDAEFRSYFAEQIEFVSRLDDLPRAALTIRLHVSSKNHYFGESERWNALDPHLKIDEGYSPILELWADSQIVVHSYDSTGLLECLASNIPCIAFWQDGLQHTMSEATPMYQRLVSAGIVHLSPTSAADHVNRYWNDVDQWWKSPRTQDARQEFAGVYARVSNKPGKDLAKLLTATKYP